MDRIIQLDQAKSEIFPGDSHTAVTVKQAYGTQPSRGCSLTAAVPPLFPPPLFFSQADLNEKSVQMRELETQTQEKIQALQAALAGAKALEQPHASEPNGVTNDAPPEHPPHAPPADAQPPTDAPEEVINSIKQTKVGVCLWPLARLCSPVGWDASLLHIFEFAKS